MDLGIELATTISHMQTMMKQLTLPRKWADILCTLALVIGLMGCGVKMDPGDPEGAHNVFQAAMFDGDAETMWNRMAPSSKEFFDGQLARLKIMDEKIVRFLPQTDHKLARKQSGSILITEVADGKALFLKVFTPAGIPQDEKFKVGSAVEEVRMSEDEKSAELVTRGQQTVHLTYDEKSEEWFVMFAETEDAVSKSFIWLDENEKALDQTIEDLIEEERREREIIIADLMDYSDK